MQLAKDIESLINLILRVETNGVVAQLGERSVRNAEVEGSNPFNSTTVLTPPLDLALEYSCTR